MVKWRWILPTLLLAGCALIDATSGGEEEDDEGIVINNANQNPNVDPNNMTPNNVDPNNVTPNSTFQPTLCGWSSCPCAYDFCDPQTACVPEPRCRTCTLDAHCESGDVCLVDGVCSFCDAVFSNGGEYRALGVDYVCEYDPFVANPVCFLLSCLE